MNPTQIQTTIAPVIGFVAGLAAGRGWFGWDQATWITILTTIVGGAAAIWGAIAARKAALTTTVANLPEVQKVELAGPGAADLAAATPSNVVVK